MAAGSTANVIAALCSFFIPGLGQLVQGRPLAAILWFVAYAICLFIAMITLGIGLVLCIPVWIINIVDAAKH